MGVQLQFGTVGATGGGWSAQPGTPQPAFLEPRNEPRWSWQQRAPKTWKDHNAWRSCWSYGARVMGGVAQGDDGSPVVYADWQPESLFEPYSCDGAGTSVSRFILGSCVDGSSNPVNGAIVQGFVTATDTFVGQVQSNLDGTYTLATDTVPGTQHYLVAYKPGSPDIAGTTVNTLTSTLVDGT